MNSLLTPNKRTGLCVSAVLALTLVASCSSSSSGGSGKGGHTGAKSLVVGVATEPGTLDPCVSDAGTELVTTTINEQLVDFDASGNLVPELASAVPQPQADKHVWRVTLRKGITFTNGEPFDAAAVKANVDRMLNGAKDGCTLYSELGSLQSVKVVDAQTVDFITKDLDPWFAYRLTLLRLVAPSVANAPKLGNDPIGTGPYELVKWNKGQDLVLKKNPHYWGGSNFQISQVTFKFMTEDATRIDALKAGEIDIAQNVPPDTPGIQKFIKSSTFIRVGTLLLNLEHAPYDDVRFRQALNYAIDKNAISKALFEGQAPPADCQMVSQGSAGFDPNVHAYPYDPAKAKSLLSQVKLPPGFVATIVSAGTLYPHEREIMQSVVSYWQAVGIKAKVNYVTLDTFGKTLFDGGPNTAKTKHDMIYIEDDNATNNLTHKLTVWWDRSSGASTFGSKIPEMDPLIHTVLTSFNAAARTTASNSLAQIGCDQAPFVYLLQRPDWWGATKNISYAPTYGTLSHMKWNRVQVG